jgi:hypothetical protein
MIDEIFPEPELSNVELVGQAARLAEAVTTMWTWLQEQPGVLANPDVFTDVADHVRHANLLLPAINEQLLEFQTERLKDARAQITALQHSQLRQSWKRKI